MTFTPDERRDVLQHLLLNLTVGKSCAILFGRIWNDPKQHKNWNGFNLRLSDQDGTGLHVVTRRPLGDDLRGGDEVMLLAEMEPRQRRSPGPNPVFIVHWLAVSR